MISTIPLTLFSYDFLTKIIVSILLIAFVSFLHAIKYTLVNEKQQPNTTTPILKQSIQTINTITNNEITLSPTLINKNHDNKLAVSISEEKEKQKELIIDTINIPNNNNNNNNNNNINDDNDSDDDNSKKTTTTTTMANVVMDDLKNNHLNTLQLSLSPLPLDTLYEESSSNKDVIINNNNDKPVTLLSTKCHDHYKNNNHQVTIMKEKEEEKQIQKPLSLKPSYSTPPTSTLYYRRRQRSSSQFLSHISISENNNNDNDNDSLLTTPMLSPSLSTSTTASNDSWSFSKVESLVNQFENKSVTSSSSLSESKPKLHQQQQQPYQSSGLKRRSFAFKPIVENWEKRIPKDKPYIAPTPSMSTPVWTNRRQ